MSLVTPGRSRTPTPSTSSGGLAQRAPGGAIRGHTGPWMPRGLRWAAGCGPRGESCAMPEPPHGRWLSPARPNRSAAVPTRGQAGTEQRSSRGGFGGYPTKARASGGSRGTYPTRVRAWGGSPRRYPTRVRAWGGSRGTYPTKARPAGACIRAPRRGADPCESTSPRESPCDADAPADRARLLASRRNLRGRRAAPASTRWARRPHERLGWGVRVTFPSTRSPGRPAVEAAPRGP